MDAYCRPHRTDSQKPSQASTRSGPRPRSSSRRQRRHHRVRRLISLLASLRAPPRLVHQGFAAGDQPAPRQSNSQRRRQTEDRKRRGQRRPEVRHTKDPRNRLDSFGKFSAPDPHDPWLAHWAQREEHALESPDIVETQCFGSTSPARTSPAPAGDIRSLGESRETSRGAPV
jgi:hypothetical protein